MRVVQAWRNAPGTGYRHLATGGGAMVIIKDVPAEVCENCGEYYLSEAVTEQILAKAEAAVMSHAEVEILRFAA